MVEIEKNVPLPEPRKQWEVKHVKLRELMEIMVVGDSVKFLITSDQKSFVDYPLDKGISVKAMRGFVKRQADAWSKKFVFRYDKETSVLRMWRTE